MVDHSLTVLTADEILVGLNRALGAERRAATDYGTHAQRSERLHIREALEALREVELEHAARLVSRITALGGTPISEDGMATAEEGGSLISGLTHDLIGEQWAIVEYARLVAHILDDDETVELMGELLQDEIRHARWLKANLQAQQPTMD